MGRLRHRGRRARRNRRRRELRPKHPFGRSAAERYPVSSRNGNTIRVEFYAAGNNTFATSPEERASLTTGFACYADEPSGKYEINLLHMVEAVVVARAALQDRRLFPVSDSYEYQEATNMREKKRMLREFISNNIQFLYQEEED